MCDDYEKEKRIYQNMSDEANMKKKQKIKKNKEKNQVQ